MKQILTFFALLILYGCHSSLLFEDVQELPEEVWNSSQIIQFETNIPDSGFYQILLSIRHTTDYEFTHLWCILSADRFPQAPVKDTLGFHIAKQDGRWLGKGDNLKSLILPLSQNPVFLFSGNIVFNIKQRMRIDQLKGVKSIGIRIEKVIE